MTTAHVDGDKWIIDHVLCYRSGILNEAIVRACCQYCFAIGHSINDLDREYKVLMPLGESQQEETENE